jgi:hypothetical protein
MWCKLRTILFLICLAINTLLYKLMKPLFVNSLNEVITFFLNKKSPVIKHLMNKLLMSLEKRLILTLNDS